MQDLVLTKGQTYDLTKVDGSALSKVHFGASWDTDAHGGFDLDIALIKLSPEKETLFFGTRDASPAVIPGASISADNRTGAGDGDDEFIKMDAKVTPDGRYALVINIFDTKNGTLDFSKVANPSVRVVDDETQAELGKFDCGQGGAGSTALLVGIIEDAGDTYKFTPKGEFMTGDLNALRAAIN